MELSRHRERIASTNVTRTRCPIPALHVLPLPLGIPALEHLAMSTTDVKTAEPRRKVVDLADHWPPARCGDVFAAHLAGVLTGRETLT